MAILTCTMEAFLDAQEINHTITNLRHIETTDINDALNKSQELIVSWVEQSLPDYPPTNRRESGVAHACINTVLSNRSTKGACFEVKNHHYSIAFNDTENQFECRHKYDTLCIKII